MLAHICNVSTWEAETHCEFQTLSPKERKVNFKNKDYKNLPPRDNTEITTLSATLPSFFSFGVLRQGFSG